MYKPGHIKKINNIKQTKKNHYQFCFYLPIRPIFIPDLARALRADWAPGPGVLVLNTNTEGVIVK